MQRGSVTLAMWASLSNIVSDGSQMACMCDDHEAPVLASVVWSHWLSRKVADWKAAAL